MLIEKIPNEREQAGERVEGRSIYIYHELKCLQVNREDSGQQRRVSLYYL